MKTRRFNLRGLALVGAMLVLSACVTPKMIQSTDLRAFTSDGCSHYPEGPRSKPKQWEACCVAHDRDYWAGGKAALRAASDAQLQQCVLQSGSSEFRSNIMWLGVRFAGGPWYPSPFRWGYGWPYYRGYKAITPEEQVQINLKEGQ
ncbi:MAG: hypothetical protein V3V09_10435 [Arenicellales bacterium]